MYKTAKEFLDPIFSQIKILKDRPFVTLTFAQSLDGKIAKQGQQVLLSGQESMAMTHRLRVLHDGILIGIGTALIDNPQLNARYLSPEDLVSFSQPQPIILDPFLKLPTDCRLLENYRSKKGKQPWLIAFKSEENEIKAPHLEKAGAKIHWLNKPKTNHICYRHLYALLKTLGIQTLMIEGGAKVIQSCLKNQAYDQLIITTAPFWIGSEGINAVLDGQKGLKQIRYQQMGDDIVLSASCS
ncbi:dihydrofolate reductase-like domain-containing protein [Sporodiniella umbellata]|nr:dihydrofolate reductase-like domain-containing protein [Sporodiniella umbellata]